MRINLIYTILFPPKYYSRGMPKHLIYEAFRFTILFATLLSLFILIEAYYDRRHYLINAWHFPMLLAIVIELYIYKDNRRSIY